MTSALILTLIFRSMSSRSTLSLWTDFTCSMTLTWCWPTRPQRTHSGWTGCNTGRPNTRSQTRRTCEWSVTKGRMNPPPRCMAVRLSDLALDSVKPFETMLHQKQGKRHPVACQDMASLSLNEIGRSALLLACCVYSVPLYMPHILQMYL